MLEVIDVVKRFGKLLVLDGCSFSVEKGECVGLIGPNGAGKTTLVNIMTGFLKCDGGKVLYKGIPIENNSPHTISLMGLVRTHQIPRVFTWETALDNLITAGLVIYDQKKDNVRRKAEKMLEMFELKGLKNEIAINLSVGQQKLLELAMKMMLDPDMLVMDEPYHGVHPSMIEKVNRRILDLNKEYGKTFLIISHNFPAIASVCKRIIVLNLGKIIADGSPEQIKNDKRVIEVYLGGA